MVSRLVETYKIWQQFLIKFTKLTKYNLGSEIDSLFLEVIKLLFRASYLNKDQKLPILQVAIEKLDLLKFFMQVAWEMKSFDNQKYILISTHLNEIGKMLGGWKNHLLKTPRNGEKIG